MMFILGRVSRSLFDSQLLFFALCIELCVYISVPVCLVQTATCYWCDHSLDKRSARLAHYTHINVRQCIRVCIGANGTRCARMCSSMNCVGLNCIQRTIPNRWLLIRALTYTLHSFKHFSLDSCVLLDVINQASTLFCFVCLHQRSILMIF